MEAEDILEDTRWKILCKISKKPVTQSELSESLNTSLANISSQMRLLKALKLVKSKKKNKKKTRGKPQSVYSLGKEFAHIRIVKKDLCEKKKISMNRLDKYVLTSYFIKEARYFLLKFYFDHEDLLKKCDSLAFFNIDKNKLNLLAINENKHELIKAFENVAITGQDKTLKILVHVYTKQDITSGINEKKELFVDMISQSILFWDENDFLYKSKVSLFS
ncbi:ArsR family transcriptional regulator [Candidatus Woesearchaeota archaeon]|nr:ArsR family transcriptional regulator [Candidatus Woesearchaeota archaeon]